VRLRPCAFERHPIAVEQLGPAGSTSRNYQVNTSQVTLTPTVRSGVDNNGNDLHMALGSLSMSIGSDSSGNPVLDLMDPHSIKYRAPDPQRVEAELGIGSRRGVIAEEGAE
jgi:hypothetical protein